MRLYFLTCSLRLVVCGGDTLSIWIPEGATWVVKTQGRVFLQKLFSARRSTHTYHGSASEINLFRKAGSVDCHEIVHG
jgi:hypothetical protein